MIYSFACPVPCNYEIRVEAKNGEDAVTRFIRAGAIRCRNVRKGCFCESAKYNFPPLQEEQLKNIVRLCMKEECGLPMAG
ncbi:MAG: hypothetical protein KBH86_13745 [Syntrophorhabdus sp.]|nr:hypothetical protein [Syntrophorhabdus sp.]